MVGRNARRTGRPAPPIQHGRSCLEPTEVTNCRLACGCQEVLVRWLGQVVADSTWVALDDFRTTYSAFQLED
jgi:hypothetical protein